MLSDAQLTFLRSQPATGATKIPILIRILGTTQEKLATAAGLAQQSLSEIVNGRDCLLSTAWKIAHAAGCGIDDIFTPPPAAVADRRSRKRTAARSIKAKPRSPKAPKARVAA
jgi:DNA-binding XRE family transcriptional regulator